MDKRQYRIADDFGFAPQFIEVDDDRLRGGADRLGCGFWNDAGPGLRPRQCGFRLQISPNQRLVAEYGTHFSGTEHVAKQS